MIVEKRNYSNGKLNGKFASYYLGSIYAKGNFSDGYMTGTWKFYNRFGEDPHIKTYTAKDSLSIDSLGIYRHDYSEIEEGQIIYSSANQIPPFIEVANHQHKEIPLGRKWIKTTLDITTKVQSVEFQRAILNEEYVEKDVIQILPTLSIWE
jgi:hypothetical protein